MGFAEGFVQDRETLDFFYLRQPNTKGFVKIKEVFASPVEFI